MCRGRRPLQEVTQKDRGNKPTAALVQRNHRWSKGMGRPVLTGNTANSPGAVLWVHADHTERSVS